jgi:putative ABC transport system permease protein
VVGVTTEYFEFRHLAVARGHLPLILGDAVLGSEVAAALQIDPGGGLITDPTKLYDLSASYPLKLHVRGVLAPSGSADDWAVFVDLKTAWVIEGIAHGHQDVDPARNPELVLRSTAGDTALNAAIVEYTEITPANIGSFHVHATAAELPITAVLVWPRDAKSGTILRARLKASEAAQPLDPEETLSELMGIVFRVKRFFDLNLGLVSMATVLFLVLIVLLTLRIRRREIDTLLKIGCSRGTVAQIQAVELGIVLAMGLFLAAGLALSIYLWITARPPVL